MALLILILYFIYCGWEVKNAFSTSTFRAGQGTACERFYSVARVYLEVLVVVACAVPVEAGAGALSLNSRIIDTHTHSLRRTVRQAAQHGTAQTAQTALTAAADSG